MWGVIYSHFLLLGPCVGLLSNAGICLWPRVKLEFNFGWGFIPMVLNESWNLGKASWSAIQYKKWIKDTSAQQSIYYYHIGVNVDNMFRLSGSHHQVQYKET